MGVPIQDQNLKNPGSGQGAELDGAPWSLGPAFLIWKPPAPQPRQACLAQHRVEWGFPGSLRELGRA